MLNRLLDSILLFVVLPLMEDLRDRLQTYADDDDEG